MHSDLMYLKPNVVIEPLYDRWYAWSHLISPTTAAMNVTGRHLKIIDSYIQAPHVHAVAVKNPKMRGGPFMDLNGNGVEGIKQLRQETIERQEHIIAFADAVKELDHMLKNEAKGYSLQGLYTKVPQILRGYVELIYDLNNQPSYRFFEHLLYKSRFYNKSSQSLALWITENDERPFVLSTPKLSADNVLDLHIPFDHKGIDELSEMKRKAKSVSYIKELLGVKPEDEELFMTFFTDTPMPPYRKYEGDNIRMRYFGHACILIETRDFSILVDPLISYYGYQSDVSRYSDIDLPDVIDYVLITHNHQDHILFETLLPLRHKLRNVIVPRSSSCTLQEPSLKMMFKNIGFDDVTELGEFDTLHFGDCVITGIPFVGEHSDLNIQSKICHHVRLGKFTMLFAADSCNIEPVLYEHVQKEIGNIDVIFLGMECDGAPLTWLYGPLLTENLSREDDNSRRLAGSNYERGMALVDIFDPKEVYVYAMGMEPWLEFITSVKYTDESNPIIASNRLVKESIEKGRTAERLYGEKELIYEKG